MKIILISILFCLTVNAQNRYLNAHASNGGDGLSMATAWNSFDDIGDYDSLEVAGVDTIYMSGGTDSTTYRGSNIFIGGLGDSTRFTSTLVFCPSWLAGHNGGVYVVNSSLTQNRNATIYKVINVKFVNINWVTNVDLDDGSQNEYGGQVNVFIQNCEDLVFENNLFRSNGSGGALTPNGVNFTFTNCTIDATYNTEARSNDIFTISGNEAGGAIGGHLFQNCIIWQRNNYGGITDDSLNITIGATTFRDADLNEPHNLHENSNVFVGGGWYLADLDSNTSDTFYDADGWSFADRTIGGEVEISTTNTSLVDVDTRHAVRVNDFVSAVITCNGKSMTITSNTATTFNGTGWSGGGNPGNGFGYTITSANPPPTFMRWFINTGAHKDLVQISYSGATSPALTTTFDKCQFYVIAPNSMRWNQTFYITGSYAPDTSAYLFTNNLVVLKVYDTITPAIDESDGRQTGAITSVTDMDATTKRTYRFYNNTFVTPNSSLYLDIVDSVWAYNNIFIGYKEQLTSWAMVLGQSDTFMDSLWIDMNNNYVYNRNWTSAYSDRFITNGNSTGDRQFLWGAWQSKYDDSAFDNWIHTDELSDTFYINMVDVIDSVTTAYLPPDTLIGVDLSGLNIPYLDEDLNGVTRGGTWWIGALQYGAAPVDSLPNAFTFTDITNATRSTLYTSNIITLAGFDSAYARAGGAEYNVNAGSYVTGYTKVFPTDQIRVRQTSSANYSTATNVVLTVGSRSDTYTVTTEAEPPPPSGDGGWVNGSNNRKIYSSDGKKVITR